MAQETKENLNELLEDAPAKKSNKKANGNGKSKSMADLFDDAKAKPAKARKVGTEAKRAAKRPSKAEVIKAGKPAAAKKGAAPAAKKAKPATGNRGVRNGEFTAAVEAATAKIKAMKAGTSKTTRELAEQYDMPPWAFRVAAGRMEEVKLKNANRVNTITRR